MREEFLITRQGRQYVLFAGLLDEAHARGLRSIETELLQVPEEANGMTAIVRARVEMEDGRTFSGLGDANPQNVGRSIAPHLIRMAETRAKARALRDAVNVGATALEELTDGEESPPVEEARSRRPRPVEEAPPGEGGSEAGRRGGRVRRSQLELLRTLAVEARGENGVERLERHIGKPLSELTREEAEAWIDRLTPAGGRE
ncbi:hypothetical protein Rxyl_0042 [Rubrobacter xylanophilus DSM 9941]|uniref:Uncharacterized protein n=1 Tax=Rubrobacter xylanophilus (strain DSM 9941 / JCM 11954 / NBRC 16129 / PRD-1) TaxID=266117 RepID=Q1B005_RUBXD|nr:hypothetical protein [Rubrobacter xylanophilus]ABG03023.1 hypothetical protein Rxyl_0042 [Rubrobacter xylanophilus DSM 9941]